MVRPRILPFLCSATLLLTPAWAAQESPSSAPPAAQTGNTQTAVPVFRTNANLVLVDVVVRSKQQPVLGLTQPDFQISEDGRPQKITVFEEHRATDALEAARSSPLPPHVYTNAPRFQLTSAANVLLLDGLNTPLSDQVYIRQRMLQFLGSIPPGTRIAVFTLGSKLSMITGFTTNAAALARALGPGRGHAEKSAVLDPDLDQALDLEINMGEALGLSGLAMAQMRQFVSDTQNFQVALREQMTLDALDELGRFLSTIPGRKNLIWFSASFPLRFLQGGSSPNMDPMADFSGRVKKTAQLLALSRVAVYPIDSRGLLNEPSTDAGATAGIPQSMQAATAGAVPGPVSTSTTLAGNTGMGSFSMDQQAATNVGPGVAADVEQRNERYVTDKAWDQFNMDQIAKETGGEAFYNQNALGKVLGEAVANGSSYYTIGYTPVDRNYDGTLRQIAVQVQGGHYDLEYRHAYFADNPADAAQWTPGRRNPLIDAMQHGSPPLSQVVFRVRVLPANDPALGNETAAPGPAGALAGQLKAPRRFMVDYWIDPRGLDHKTQPDGGMQSQVELTAVAYDAEGVRVNYADQAMSLSQTQQQAAKALEGGLPLHQQIDLPADGAYLRVGVHDILSGRMGTLEIAVPGARQH